MRYGGEFIPWQTKLEYVYSHSAYALCIGCSLSVLFDFSLRFHPQAIYFGKQCQQLARKRRWRPNRRPCRPNRPVGGRRSRGWHWHVLWTMVAAPSSPCSCTPHIELLPTGRAPLLGRVPFEQQQPGCELLESVQDFRVSSRCHQQSVPNFRVSPNATGSPCQVFETVQYRRRKFSSQSKATARCSDKNRSTSYA
jgi:hypothetical protein